MTAATKERRKVRYSSLQEFCDDVEKLAAGKHETVGNWTFPQILNHLTKAMNYSFDGYPFRAPFFIRAFARWKYKKTLLTKGLPTGIKVPKAGEALLPVEAESSDLEQALSDFRVAVSRYECETPTALHPFIGKLTAEEAGQMNLRHGELHMSFVRPIES